jgi:hypothetical protein
LVNSVDALFCGSAVIIGCGLQGRDF